MTSFDKTMLRVLGGELVAILFLIGIALGKYIGS